MKQRLDQMLVQLRLALTRSQAKNYIKLGLVQVDGEIITKSGEQVTNSAKIKLLLNERYVSRAAFKLAGAADNFGLDFKGKVVLDVGSSTGGFTDYALRHGASKVVAVDIGTDQLHPSLRLDKRIELYEKTDIRDFSLKKAPDIILADVSFISLRQILPHLSNISSKSTQIIAMLKPQFEAGKTQTNRGVIKNDRVRRQILKDFELWVKELFIIKAKADSEVAGAKGNQERFYLLKPL